MSAVFTAKATSVDGYITGPDPSPSQALGRGGGALFDWYGNGDTPRPDPARAGVRAPRHRRRLDAALLAERGQRPRWGGPGVDAARDEGTTWYVDLLHVTGHGREVIVRNLYIDVMVPTDGRHQRLLDFDEFADAIDEGHLPIEVATDALRRGQRFLDRHLHRDRDPTAR
jgi:hypothetical protein